MAKVSICLRQNDDYVIYDCFDAVKVDDIVKYKDNMFNFVDFKCRTLRRLDNDYEIAFDFNKGICFYSDSAVKMEYDIDVLEMDVSLDMFFVKYKLVDDIFTYKVEVL